MDISKLLASLRRWWWVIVAVSVVTAGAAALHVIRTEAPYQARVMLQLTAPRDVDASVLDAGNASTSTLRDDLTLVQNDFTTVVGTTEVRRRTDQQLGLQGADANYSVSVSPVGDSNFITVLVSTPNPKLAQAIADAHVAQSIKFLGELRAKPANDTKQLLASQLQAARDKLPATPPPGSTQPVSVDAQDAQTTYQALLAKYTQAALVAENAAQASYIQVASPAAEILRPTLRHRLLALDVFALLGGLGLGVLLVIVLEQASARPLHENPHPVLSGRGNPFRAPHTKRFNEASRYHAASATNGLQPASLAHSDDDASNSA
jgi:uncharacterized protein involved in exopolysaccharide biosynthesis